MCSAVGELTRRRDWRANSRPGLDEWKRQQEGLVLDFHAGRNGDALSDAEKQSRFDAFRSMKLHDLLVKCGRRPPVHGRLEVGDGLFPLMECQLVRDGGQLFNPSDGESWRITPCHRVSLAHNMPSNPRKLKEMLGQEVLMDGQLIAADCWCQVTSVPNRVPGEAHPQPVCRAGKFGAGVRTVGTSGTVTSRPSRPLLTLLP